MRDSGRAVDLILRDYTTQVETLQVEKLREDRSDMGEARVLRRVFEVPPPSGAESAGVVRRPDPVARSGIPSGRD